MKYGTKMKGLLENTIFSCVKNGKSLEEIRMYLKENYSIHICMKALKSRIKNMKVIKRNIKEWEHLN